MACRSSRVIRRFYKTAGKSVEFFSSPTPPGCPDRVPLARTINIEKHAIFLNHLPGPYQLLIPAEKEHTAMLTIIRSFALLSQLSPETFDPRKMDANYLEANFEYFRLSATRDDKDNENCFSYFLVFGLKSC